MSLRLYLIGLMLSTIFCWGCFILVLFYIDPTQTSLMGYVAFYSSLFFALTGLFSLVGFYLRVWFSKNEILFRHISVAFRQGILFATILVVSLILQSFRILTWWDGFFLVGAGVLLEFYFISRKPHKI